MSSIEYFISFSTAASSSSIYSLTILSCNNFFAHTKQASILAHISIKTSFGSGESIKSQINCFFKENISMNSSIFQSVIALSRKGLRE